MTQAQTETAKPRIRLPPRTTADTKGKSPIGYHPPTDRAPVVLAIRSGDWCARVQGGVEALAGHARVCGG